jgi:hypothetical protein
MQTYRFVGDRKTFVKRDDLAKLRELIPITDPKRGRLNEQATSREP